MMRLAIFAVILTVLAVPVYGQEVATQEAPVAADIVSGKVISVDASSSMIIIEQAAVAEGKIAETTEVEVMPDTKIFKAGVESKIQDIQAGDMLKAEYKTDEAGMKKVATITIK